MIKGGSCTVKTTSRIGITNVLYRWLKRMNSENSHKFNPDTNYSQGWVWTVCDVSTTFECIWRRLSVRERATEREREVNTVYGVIKIYSILIFFCQPAMLPLWPGRVCLQIGTNMRPPAPHVLLVPLLLLLMLLILLLAVPVIPDFCFSHLNTLGVCPACLLVSWRLLKIEKWCK